MTVRMRSRISSREEGRRRSGDVTIPAVLGGTLVPTCNGGEEEEGVRKGTSVMKEEGVG